LLLISAFWLLVSPFFDEDTFGIPINIPSEGITGLGSAKIPQSAPWFVPVASVQPIVPDDWFPPSRPTTHPSVVVRSQGLLQFSFLISLALQLMLQGFCPRTNQKLQGIFRITQNAAIRSLPDFSSTAFHGHVYYVQFLPSSAPWCANHRLKPDTYWSK
jgi:hypothetical protein